MIPRSYSIKRWFWRGAKFVLIAAAIGGLLYWIKFSPVPVKEHRIERGQIIAEVMGTGTLEARVRVTVSPKISGRIERILVDQGDHVSQGDPLFQLDDEELKQQVEMAQATLEAAEAAVERVQADRSRAAAVLALAKLEHARPSGSSRPMPSLNRTSTRPSKHWPFPSLALPGRKPRSSKARKASSPPRKLWPTKRTRLAETKITAPFDGLMVKRYVIPAMWWCPAGPYCRWFRWRNCGSAPGSMKPRWTASRSGNRLGLSFVPSRNDLIRARWLDWEKRPTAKRASSSSTSGPATAEALGHRSTSGGLH